MKVRDRFDLDLQEVDIRSNPALFQRYKDIIPVMIIDDRTTLGARVEEEEVREALAETES